MSEVPLYSAPRGGARALLGAVVHARTESRTCLPWDDVGASALSGCAHCWSTTDRYKDFVFTNISVCMVEIFCEAHCVATLVLERGRGSL